jgi:sulfite exporter TauE/SafE
MFYTALIMGLAGSLHCAGMCSPLAMAVTRTRSFTLAILLYNTGRILTYACLGATAAMLGSYINWVPYQFAVSLTLGIIFLAWGINGYRRIRVPFLGNGIERIGGYLKNLFAEFLKRKSAVSTFMMGMLNGLLPCGLTYIALSACLILPRAEDGFLFMIIFGLGTWPVMIGFTRLLNKIMALRKFSLAKMSRIAFVFIGCILLARTFSIHPPEKISTTHSSGILCE